MTTITVNVDDEAYEKFRKLAAEERNGKKGFLGDAITAVMKKRIEEKEQEAIKKRLLERIKKGYNLGGLKEGFKREDLYERH